MKVLHLEFLCSNHRSLLVCFDDRVARVKCGRRKRKSRFHFEEAWSDDPDCRDIVKGYWSHSLPCISMENLVDKLDFCGKNVLFWGRENFKSLNSDIAYLKKNWKCYFLLIV